MLSTYVKKGLIVLVATGFISTSSFAAYHYRTNTTHCANGYCKHVVVKKNCRGGQCHTYRHWNAWHR